MSRRILSALAVVAGLLLILAAPATAVEDDLTGGTEGTGATAGDADADAGGADAGTSDDERVLICYPKGDGAWEIVAVTPERADSALAYEGAKLPAYGSCTDVVTDETTDTVDEPTDDTDTSTDETETETDTSTDDTDTSTDDTTRDETETDTDISTEETTVDEPEPAIEEDEPVDEEDVEVLPRVQDNPDPEDADEPVPTLAETGANSSSLARYGAVLMLAGLGLVVASGRAAEVSRRQG